MESLVSFKGQKAASSLPQVSFRCWDTAEPLNLGVLAQLSWAKSYKRLFATLQLNYSKHQCNQLISCFLSSTDIHYLLFNSLIKEHIACIPSLHLPAD